MLLTIDVGNTLTDFGVFDGETLLRTFKTESVSTKSADEYESIVRLFIQSKALDPAEITEVIISSVVPSLTRVFSYLSLLIFRQNPILVGPHLRTGLLLKVDHPAEVGSDLVADAVGGTKLYGSSLFIADLGTANKFLFVDKEMAFAGLAIAPGLAISMDALVNRTSALPEVSWAIPEKVMGKNTKDCMNSGITYGTAFQLEGFAKAFEKECGYPLKKILTGGNAMYVKDLLPDFHYDEFLILKGLCEIARRHHQ
jgi:type III pantothenate kinase